MLDKIDKKKPGLRKKLLKPFVVNINPDIVTYLALIAAILAGISFYYGYFVVAAVLVFLNAFLDVLDGQIAKKFKRQTLRGDFLDHFLDRVADVAIILGIVLRPEIPVLIGFGLVIVTILVSYLGTAAQALTKKRLYGGMIGRSDRLVLLMLTGIAAYFWADGLYWGTVIIFALSTITLLQRYVIVYKALGE